MVDNTVCGVMFMEGPTPHLRFATFYRAVLVFDSQPHSLCRYQNVVEVVQVPRARLTWLDD